MAENSEKATGQAQQSEGLAYQVNRLVLLLERVRLAEYVEIMQRPWLLARRSFLGGLFRGMGFALGFLLLSALALYILNLLVDLGIPILGDFIAELLVYVESVQQAR